MDSMVDLLGELVNPEFNILKNLYQAKRLVSKLGLTYDRIHYCVNDSMLFHKTDSELENYMFCGHARYKSTSAEKCHARAYTLSRTGIREPLMTQANP